VPKGKVNIRIKRNLVKAGAFDGLEDRSALLERVLEVADPDILQMERETLGLYITGHPLDDFDYDDGTIHIVDIVDLPVGEEFKTVGIIEKLKPHVDVRDGNMTFVTIADQTHQLEVVVFASLYGGDLEEGDVLHLQGEVDDHKPLKALAIDYEVMDLQLAAQTV
jgi:DNA polymerase-3 subunit alpha